MEDIPAILNSDIGRQSIEIARPFLGKLLKPSIEEMGLLLGDKITFNFSYFFPL